MSLSELLLYHLNSEIKKLSYSFILFVSIFLFTSAIISPAFSEETSNFKKIYSYDFRHVYHIIERDSFDLFISPTTIFKITKQWNHLDTIYQEKSCKDCYIQRAILLGNELQYVTIEDTNLVWKKFNIDKRHPASVLCSIPVCRKWDYSPWRPEILSERFTCICKTDTVRIFDLQSKSFIKSIPYSPAQICATTVDQQNQLLYCGLDRTVKPEFQSIDLLRISTDKMDVIPIQSIIQPHVISKIMFQKMCIAQDGTVYFEHTVHKTGIGTDNNRRTDTTYLYKTNPFNGDFNLYRTQIDFKSHRIIEISKNYIYRFGTHRADTPEYRYGRTFLEAIPISSLNDKWVKLTKE
jgi:hypothetical protein